MNNVINILRSIGVLHKKKMYCKYLHRDVRNFADLRSHRLFESILNQLTPASKYYAMMYPNMLH